MVISLNNRNTFRLFRKFVLKVETLLMAMALKVMHFSMCGQENRVLLQPTALK
jgi:hypothetical protein